LNPRSSALESDSHLEPCRQGPWNNLKCICHLSSG
jgi:hypothetical protein